MALSHQVEDSLHESVCSLRNALAFAARNERPMVCKVIAETISRIENVMKTDEILDKLDERQYGDSGRFPPDYYDDDCDM